MDMCPDSDHGDVSAADSTTAAAATGTAMATTKTAAISSEIVNHGNSSTTRGSSSSSSRRSSGDQAAAAPVGRRASKRVAVSEPRRSMRRQVSAASQQQQPLEPVRKPLVPQKTLLERMQTCLPSKTASLLKALAKEEAPNGKKQQKSAAAVARKRARRNGGDAGTGTYSITDVDRLNNSDSETQAAAAAKAEANSVVAFAKDLPPTNLTVCEAIERVLRYLARTQALDWASCHAATNASAESNCGGGGAAAAAAAYEDDAEESMAELYLRAHALLRAMRMGIAVAPPAASNVDEAGLMTTLSGSLAATSTAANTSAANVENAAQNLAVSTISNHTDAAAVTAVTKSAAVSTIGGSKVAANSAAATAAAATPLVPSAATGTTDATTATTTTTTTTSTTTTTTTTTTATTITKTTTEITNIAKTAWQLTAHGESFRSPQIFEYAGEPLSGEGALVELVAAELTLQLPESEAAAAAPGLAPMLILLRSRLPDCTRLDVRLALCWARLRRAQWVAAGKAAETTAATATSTATTAINTACSTCTTKGTSAAAARVSTTSSSGTLLSRRRLYAEAIHWFQVAQRAIISVSRAAVSTDVGAALNGHTPAATASAATLAVNSTAARISMPHMCNDRERCVTLGRIKRYEAKFRAADRVERARHLANTGQHSAAANMLLKSLDGVVTTRTQFEEHMLAAECCAAVAPKAPDSLVALLRVADGIMRFCRDGSRNSATAIQTLGSKRVRNLPHTIIALAAKPLLAAIAPDLAATSSSGSHGVGDGGSIYTPKNFVLSDPLPALADSNVGCLRRLFLDTFEVVRALSKTTETNNSSSSRASSRGATRPAAPKNLQSWTLQLLNAWGCLFCLGLALHAAEARDKHPQSQLQQQLKAARARVLWCEFVHNELGRALKNAGGCCTGMAGEILKATVCVMQGVRADLRGCGVLPDCSSPARQSMDEELDTEEVIIDSKVVVALPSSAMHASSVGEGEIGINNFNGTDGSAAAADGAAAAAATATCTTTTIVDAPPPFIHSPAHVLSLAESVLAGLYACLYGADCEALGFGPAPTAHNSMEVELERPAAAALLEFCQRCPAGNRHQRDRYIWRLCAERLALLWPSPSTAEEEVQDFEGEGSDGFSSGEEEGDSSGEEEEEEETEEEEEEEETEEGEADNNKDNALLEGGLATASTHVELTPGTARSGGNQPLSVDDPFSDGGATLTTSFEETCQHLREIMSGPVVLPLPSPVATYPAFAGADATQRELYRLCADKRLGEKEPFSEETAPKLSAWLVADLACNPQRVASWRDLGSLYAHRVIREIDRDPRNGAPRAVHWLCVSVNCFERALALGVEQEEAAAAAAAIVDTKEGEETETETETETEMETEKKQEEESEAQEEEEEEMQNMAEAEVEARILYATLLTTVHARHDWFLHTPPSAVEIQAADEKQRATVFDKLHFQDGTSILEWVPDEMTRSRSNTSTSTSTTTAAAAAAAAATTTTTVAAATTTTTSTTTSLATGTSAALVASAPSAATTSNASATNSATTTTGTTTASTTASSAMIPSSTTASTGSSTAPTTISPALGSAAPAATPSGSVSVAEGTGAATALTFVGVDESSTLTAVQTTASVSANSRATKSATTTTEPALTTTTTLSAAALTSATTPTGVSSSGLASPGGSGGTYVSGSGSSGGGGGGAISKAAAAAAAAKAKAKSEAEAAKARAVAEAAAQAAAEARAAELALLYRYERRWECVIRLADTNLTLRRKLARRRTLSRVRACTLPPALSPTPQVLERALDVLNFDAVTGGADADTAPATTTAIRDVVNSMDSSYRVVMLRALLKEGLGAYSAAVALFRRALDDLPPLSTLRGRSASDAVKCRIAGAAYGTVRCAAYGIESGRVRSVEAKGWIAALDLQSATTAAAAAETPTMASASSLSSVRAALMQLQHIAPYDHRVALHLARLALSSKDAGAARDTLGAFVKSASTVGNKTRLFGKRMVRLGEMDGPNDMPGDFLAACRDVAALYLRALDACAMQEAKSVAKKSLSTTTSLSLSSSANSSHNRSRGSITTTTDPSSTSSSSSPSSTNSSWVAYDALYHLMERLGREHGPNLSRARQKVIYIRHDDAEALMHQAVAACARVLAAHPQNRSPGLTKRRAHLIKWQ